jgi:hypothetical protein
MRLQHDQAAAADALYNDKTSVEQRAVSQLKSTLNVAQNKPELLDEILKSVDALHLKIVSQVTDPNTPGSRIGTYHWEVRSRPSPLQCNEVSGTDQGYSRQKIICFYTIVWMLKCLQTLLSLALCQGDKTSLPKLM